MGAFHDKPVTVFPQSNGQREMRKEQPPLIDRALQIAANRKLAPALAVLLVPLIMFYALALIVHVMLIRPCVALWKAVGRARH